MEGGKGIGVVDLLVEKIRMITYGRGACLDYVGCRVMKKQGKKKKKKYWEGRKKEKRRKVFLREILDQGDSHSLAHELRVKEENNQKKRLDAA